MKLLLLLLRDYVLLDYLTTLLVLWRPTGRLAGTKRESGTNAVLSAATWI